MDIENSHCRYMKELTETRTSADDTVVTLAQKMYNEPIDNILKYKKDVFELFTESKLKRMLTEFEFYNMKIEPETKCLDDVIKKCENILNRYTYCAGGCRLEDKDWVIYRKGDKKYKLKDNEIIFENSIPSIYKDDYETDKFLRQINKLFNEISEKIKSECIFIECERMNIHWVLFVIKKI